jgi:branched-chain amino acid transport system permease protein
VSRSDARIGGIPQPQVSGGTFLFALLPLAGAIALALTLHFLAVGGIIPDFPATVLRQVGIFIILAVSLNIVNGYTGQFSIGHAGFLAIGGYAAATITFYGGMLLFGTPAKEGGFLGAGEWLLFAGCIVGGIVAALCGYVVGLPSLRLRGDYLAVVTLGFGEIVRVLLQRTKSQVFTLEDLKSPDTPWWPPPLGGAQGFKELPTYTNLFWAWLFAGITVIAAFRIKQSSMGRAFLSIREDEIAARAMGVDIAKYKVRAFVIAAFFAGIAGALYGHSGVNLEPRNAGFMLSFELIIMVVLGGLGSLSGVVMAAIILTILPEVLRDPASVIRATWIPVVAATLVFGAATAAARKVGRGERVFLTLTILSAALLVVAGLASLGNAAIQKISDRSDANLGDYRMIIYALLLITMMLVRPQGLFGVMEIWDFFGRKPAGAKQ